MSRMRSFSLWNPKRHALVRVAFGPGRGALGVVRQKRSRWGVTLVEVETYSPKRPGEWLEVGSWRLRPAETLRGAVPAPVEASPNDAVAHGSGATSDHLPVGA